MSFTNKFSILNKDTGEVHDIAVRVPRRVSIGGNWLMFFQESLFDIITNKNVTPEALRVFSLMLKYTDYENGITITQKEICDILEINAQRVSKAVKILVENGIIIKPKNKKPSDVFKYHLSPLIGWKGRATSYHDFKLKRLEDNTNEA